MVKRKGIARRLEQPDLEMLGQKSDSKDDLPIPTNKEGKSDEIYEVKKVLEHLLSPDGFFLKVRWEGYGSDEDSWEPERDLKECANDIVSEYINTLTSKQQTAIANFKKSIERREEEKKKKKAKKASKSKSPKKAATTGAEEENKKSKRLKSISSDEEDSESDSDSTKKKKKRRVSKATDEGSYSPSSTSRRRSRDEKKSVSTKAAVKSFDIPNSAKQAAFQHRQAWLDDSDSSDDDDNREKSKSDERTFDDEIKEKVAKKKMPKKDSKTPEEKSSTPQKVTQKNKQKHDTSSSKEKEDTASASPKSSNTSVAKNGTGGDKNSRHIGSEWNIEGVVENHKDGKDVFAVLLMNKETLERKVVEHSEAFEEAGWNLCQYLLKRCVFEKQT